MLTINQNPDRVSNILRSSTPMIRLMGMGRTAGRSRGAITAVSVVAVRVLMLLLLRRRRHAGIPR